MAAHRAWLARLRPHPLLQSGARCGLGAAGGHSPWELAARPVPGLAVPVWARGGLWAVGPHVWWHHCSPRTPPAPPRLHGCAILSLQTKQHNPAQMHPVFSTFLRVCACTGMCVYMHADLYVCMYVNHLSHAAGHALSPEASGPPVPMAEAVLCCSATHEAFVCRVLLVLSIPVPLCCAPAPLV